MTPAGDGKNGGHRPGQGRGKLKQETPQAQLQELDKESKAVQAILRGMSYEQAARVAGYTDRSGAYKAVQRALARGHAEVATDADALRALQGARLDRVLLELTRVAFDPATTPEIRLKYLLAIDRNINTRSNLYGLNAPIQHEVFTHDALNLKISQLAEELGLPVPERIIESEWRSGTAGEAALPEGSSADQA